ncbi:hypothetical protein GPECTOR_415g267 [Gonium pectorale]|uniref:Uncharacterized protein n=1 Tax=Gonium pectorale TaxID=33097 RepID=A0A150FV76_GONPE|nr:hypothetical protein GPECTOR_415g267 [Gonium pectorale]|eukprot:KXZ41523.1 hypothetical protein GPECTOR_415g267 [Gonium pectorale]
MGDSVAVFSGLAGLKPGRMTVRSSEAEARRTGNMYRVHPGGALRDEPAPCCASSSE